MRKKKRFSLFHHSSERKVVQLTERPKIIRVSAHKTSQAHHLRNVLPNQKRIKEVKKQNEHFTTAEKRFRCFFLLHSSRGCFSVVVVVCLLFLLLPSVRQAVLVSFYLHDIAIWVIFMATNGFRWTRTRSHCARMHVACLHGLEFLLLSRDSIKSKRNDVPVATNRSVAELLLFRLLACSGWHWRARRRFYGNAPWAESEGVERKRPKSRGGENIRSPFFM